MMITQIKRPSIKLINDYLLNNLGFEDIKYIDLGSCRAVFKLGESKIIKIAFNKAGIEQNLSEYNSRNSNYIYDINNLIEDDHYGPWIIIGEYVEPIIDYANKFYEEIYEQEKVGGLTLYLKQEFSEFDRAIIDCLIEHEVEFIDEFKPYLIENYSSKLKEVMSVEEINVHNIGIREDKSIVSLDGGVKNDQHYNEIFNSDEKEYLFKIFYDGKD